LTCAGALGVALAAVAVHREVEYRQWASRGLVLTALAASGAFWATVGAFSDGPWPLAAIAALSAYAVAAWAFDRITRSGIIVQRTRS
jgi:hypothetical protein